jgi:superfamily I DNA and/or RNA helicase
MHPILGAFVSQAFYEPYGEGFGSPRPAIEFDHHLEHYQGKVAAWADIPMRAGKEGKGRSKSRPVEARWIAGEAARILELRPDLSVGVITFYVAQVREILDAMRQLGLALETDMGVQIGDAYAARQTTEGETRLRVGTVDAFQGREFDVVLLSMTRSNSIVANDLVSYRRKYGFLTLENRLCVAMSRQKRLLIVAGDAGMVRETGAEEAIPGLKAFYELCGGEYGLRLQA